MAYSSSVIMSSKRYGSGDITDPRDMLLQLLTNLPWRRYSLSQRPAKKTFIDLYLIHQQGWKGAADHVSHPERIAWKSMQQLDYELR
jgi:hypothetical protein